MWAISFSLIMFSGVFTSCSNTDDPETPPTTGEKSPYITRVLDFRPAVGQFVNQLPEYKEGDTQEDMNRKVLEAIGNNKQDGYGFTGRLRRIYRCRIRPYH